ncbi:MAG: hypothetical protein Q4B50_05555, partial [Bacillota bacterium]|nr:hypothetical protein [Bacillota bacterium]
MPKENDINVDNNEKKDLKVNEEVNLDPKDNEVQVPKNGEENQLDEEKKKELAALNAKEEEKNKENPEENKESEKKEEKEEAKKDGEEKKEEGEKESLQEGKIKEGASPEKKKTGSLGEQEGDSFNLEMLRDNPKLAKRLATTIDKEGRMGSVFQEEEDAEYEFRKDPEKAMERIQDLASRGKLFLRERGKDTFHKLEKDSEGGYKLGEGFAQKSSPPYDYAYGLLIQMTAGFFKLSFGKNWFSDRAERFRSWLKMDISIDEEKQEIQDEREQAKSDEKKAKKKQEKAEKRRLKKLAKEEKKKQKQEQ